MAAKWKHQGCSAELHAVLWLLDQGYEVFRNVSQHGIADLVAWKPGEPPLFFDVKTGPQSPAKTKPEQRASGVQILLYNKATGDLCVQVPLKRGGYRPRSGRKPKV